MIEYKSFQTSKRKLQTLWEQSQKNENDINNLTKIKLDFSSISFNKVLTTISVLENRLLTSNDTFFTIELDNIPDRFINSVRVLPIFFVEDAWNLSNAVNSLTEEFQNGTLVDGMIQIPIAWNYWWTKIDDQNYTLKMFFIRNTRIASVSGPGFSSSPVPTFLNLSLQILNDNIYESLDNNKK